jgi:ankyrin repeat protein
MIQLMKSYLHTPLYEASGSGFLNVCKFLIESGADVDALNK